MNELERLSPLILFFFCPCAFSVAGVLLITISVKNNKAPLLWVFIPFGMAIIFTAVFSIVIVYEPSGFVRFMISASTMMGSIIAGIIATVYIVRSWHHRRSVMVFYIISCVFALISSVFGIKSSNVLINKCEILHEETGNAIAVAISNYYNDKNNFPENLSELVPLYIDNSTIKTCFKLAAVLYPREYGGYTYMKCSPKIAEFYIQEMNLPEVWLQSYHVYHLDEHEWYLTKRSSEWAEMPLCPQE
ncbi:MAG: hypothetical protein IPP66_01655 [Anaerolineales bacterium]|nr:hypothetical protein [Anaerolineales bacterium]